MTDNCEYVVLMRKGFVVCFEILDLHLDREPENKISYYSSQLTSTKQYSPSSEADSHSASQEIPHLLRTETEGLLPCSQEPSRGSYSEPHEPITHPHILLI